MAKGGGQKFWGGGASTTHALQKKLDFSMEGMIGDKHSRKTTSSGGNAGFKREGKSGWRSRRLRHQWEKRVFSVGGGGI